MIFDQINITLISVSTMEKLFLSNVCNVLYICIVYNIHTRKCLLNCISCRMEK